MTKSRTLALAVVDLAVLAVVGAVALVALVAVGCAPPAVDASPDASPDDASPDDDSAYAADCAFVDVAFSPTDSVVQGVSDDESVCARLERVDVAERRGITWQATRLFVDARGQTFDVDGDDGDGSDDVLSYENTHHNCRDVAGARVGGVEVSLTIDGVSDDPAVCFDPSSTAWVLRLAIDGGDEVLLRPR